MKKNNLNVKLVFFGALVVTNSLANHLKVESVQRENIWIEILIRVHDESLSDCRSVEISSDAHVSAMR